MIGLVVAFVGISVSMLGTGLPLYYQGRVIESPYLRIHEGIAKKMKCRGKQLGGLGFTCLIIVLVIIIFLND